MIKKITLLLVLTISNLLFFNTYKLYAQPTLEYANGYGTTGTEQAKGIVRDNANNIIQVGIYLTAGLDLDGAGTGAPLGASLGNNDVFVAKYNPDGKNLQWVVSFGSSGTETVNDVAVDAGGNIYVAGSYAQGANFPPFSNRPVNGIASTDFFVAKMNSSGTVTTLITGGGTGVLDEVFSVDVDNAGNIFVLGTFNGSSVNFGAATYTANNTDVFLAKYDASGNNLWARQIGSSNADVALGLDVDNAQNVVVTGAYAGTLSMTGTGIQHTASGTLSDIFLVKYNNAGTYLWSKGVGGTSVADQGRAVTTDAIGDVYLTGSFTGTGVDFNAGAPSVFINSSGGSQDAFIAKYNGATGQNIWARPLGGTGTDAGVAIGLFGTELYVGGTYSAAGDFDPSGATVTLPLAGGTDIFLGKYATATGNYIWAGPIGGTTADQLASIHVSDKDQVILNATSAGTVDFDPSPLVTNVTSVNAGDVFMASYGPPYYYSRQTGNWEDPVTWSHLGYTGPPCGCTPGYDGNVFVGNTYFVTKSNTTVAQIDSLTIDFNSALNMLGNASSVTTNYFTNQGTGGNGKISFAAPNFITVAIANTFNNTMGTGWGTVEYTGTAYTLPPIGTYPTLVISGAGLKTLSTGPANTVNGELVLTPGSQFTINSPAELNLKGNLSNDGLFNSNTVFTFNNTTMNQMLSGTGISNFNQLLLDKSSNTFSVDLGMNIYANTSVGWASPGLLKLNNSNLTMGPSAIFMNYAADKYVSTDGTGLITKQGTTTSNFVQTYPLGRAGNYNPFYLSSLSAGLSGTAQLNMRSVSNGSCIDCGTSYLALTTQNFVSLILASFTFRTPTNGTSYNKVTQSNTPLGAGYRTITTLSPTEAEFGPNGGGGITALAGDWRLVNIPDYYYSRRTGNWEDATAGNATWSNTAGGPSCDCTPGTNAVVRIMNGHTVTKSTAAGASVDTLTIDAGGLLDVKENGNSYTINVFTSKGTGGNGTFRLGSAAGLTIPTITTTDFFTLLGTGNSTTEITGVANPLPAYPTYRNLRISSFDGTGVKNQNSTAVTVEGNLTIDASCSIVMNVSATTFNVKGNAIINGQIGGNSGLAKVITIDGNLSGTGTINLSGGLAHILELKGASNSIGTFTTGANTTKVKYSGTGNQQIFASGNYRKLEISGGGTKSLTGLTALADSLVLRGAILNMAGNNLNVNITGDGNIRAGLPFGSSNMIIAGANPLSVGFNTTGNEVFPLGTGSLYTPVTVTLSALTGSGSISARPVTGAHPNAFNPATILLKNWDMGQTGFTSLSAQLQFRYDDSELQVIESSYTHGGQYKGALPWVTDGTVNAASNDITFSRTLTDFNGQYTAGPLAAFTAGRYYSRQSGSWESPTTWSTASHTDPTGCGCIPGANAVVYVGNGHTVNVTTSTAISLDSLKIDASSILDLATFGTTVSVAKAFANTGTGGNGKLKITAPSGTANFINMLGGSTNYFTTASGTGAGTVEYYGSATYLLPSSTTVGTYQNLEISGGGIKSLGGGTYNVNGSLKVNGGTFDLNSGSIMVMGTTDVFGTLHDFGFPGTNNFNGLVTINPGATFTTNNNSPYNFAGGITNNNGTINMTGTGLVSFIGTQTFDVTAGSTTSFSGPVNSDSWTIQGSGPFTFLNNVTIGTSLTLTNKHTNLQIEGILNGASGSSVWYNESGSLLKYKHGTAPMLTGILNTNGSGNNTVEYNGGLQTIKVPPSGYWNLTISGTNIKSPTAGGFAIMGDFVVNTNTTFAAANAGTTTVSVMGNMSGGGILDLSPGAHPHVFELNGTNNTIGAFIPGVSLVQYNGANQNVITATYYDIGFGAGSDKTLLGSIEVLNNATFYDDSRLILGNNNLTLNGNSIITGTPFSNVRGIVYTGANSGGSIIQKGTSNAHFQKTFPMITPAGYSELAIASINGVGGSAQLTIKPYDTTGTNVANVNLKLAANFTSTMPTTFTFTTPMTPTPTDVTKNGVVVTNAYENYPTSYGLTASSSIQDINGTWRFLSAGPIITGFTPSTVCGGDTVTITGSGFTGTTQINFNGGMAIAFQVIDDNTIKAATTNGNTSGLITVINGTSVNSATSLTINLAPVNGASIVAIPNMGICLGQGAAAAILGSETGTTYEVYLNGTATGLTKIGTGTNDTISIPAAQLNSTGTFNVTFKATKGSCAIMLSSFTNISVNPMPAAPTFSAITPICENTGITLTPATGGPLFNFYDAPSAGVLLANGVSDYSTGLLTTTTTFYVTSTNGGSCENPGRTAVTVSVNSSPVAPTVTTPVEYCQLAPSTALTATGTGLLWYAASTGGTGSSTAPVPSTATMGTTSHFVSQTVSGCEGPRAQIDVIINPPLLANANGPFMPNVCDGTPVTLSGSASGSPTTISWVGGLGTLANANTFTPTYTHDPSEVGFQVNFMLTVSKPGCIDNSDAVAFNIDPIPGTPSFTTTDPTCGVLNDGQINIATVAGEEYSIDGTSYQTSGIFTGLTGGSYPVTARNTSNPMCVSSAGTATLTTPTPPSSPSVDFTTQPTCGAPFGTIVLFTSAGLEYSVDGISYQTSGSFTPLSPGVYSNITARYVSDPSCMSTPISETINPIPAGPTATISVASINPICPGASTDFTVTLVGGTDPFNFTLTNGTNSFNYTSQISPATVTVFPTVNGNFEITNISDANSCTSVGPFGSEPVNISPDPVVTLSAPSSANICNGGTTNFTVTLTTGTDPFNFVLSNGADNFSFTSQTSPATVPVSPSASGNFEVIAVTDGSGCLSTPATFGSEMVNVVSAPVATLSAPSTANICTGGSVDFTVTLSVGTGPFDFELSNGTNNFTFTNQTSPATVTVFPTVSGDWSVINLADANCTAAGSFGLETVTILSPPAAPGITETQPTCSSLTGTIAVSPVVAGEEYSIDGSTYITSGVFSGVTPGNYNVTTRITASPSCVSTATLSTINAPLTPPSAPSISTTQPTCSINTGSIIVSTVGGEEYSVDGSTYQPAPSFNGLISGPYNVTARLTADPTCISTATVATIDPVPTPPAAPTLALTQPTCSLPTGTIEVTVPLGEEYSIDGTTYSASTTFTSVTSGSYNVTVRLAIDNSCVSSPTVATIDPAPAAPAAPALTLTQPSCSVPTGTIDVTAPLGEEYSIDGTTYFASATFTAVASGTYNVTVRLTSDNTCISPSSPAIINAPPTLPAAPTLTLTQPTCSAPNGTIDITAPLGEQYSIDGTNYFTSPTFNSVVAGTYNVTVRLASDNTCISASTPATITAASTIPAAPTLALTQPTCSLPTGTIDVTTPLGEEYSIDGTTYFTSATFTSVASGTYNVTVRLASDNTCISPSSPATINAAPTLPAAPALTLTQPTCSAPTGTIDVTAPLGEQYSIDGTNYFTSATFNSVVSGTYNVTVRLASDNTCISPATAVTIDPAPSAPPTPTVNVAQPTCAMSTGAIEIAAPLGEEYSIDGITYSIANIYSMLASGPYTVTVRLASDNTCISAAVPITINPAPTAPTAPTLTLTQPTCSLPTGTIDVTAPLGEEYSIDGSVYSASSTFTAVASGSYNVTVRLTTDNTCISPATSATIDPVPTVPAAPTLLPVTQPTCSFPFGNVNVSVNAGEEYSIDGTLYQLAGSFIAVAPATSYNVTARYTADPSCVSTASIATVDPVPTPPAAPTVTTTDATCSVPTGIIEVTAPLGEEYSINGSTYFSTAIFNAVTPGAYSVTARLASDITCISTATPATINPAPTVPAAPTLTLTQPTCSVPTGTIDVTAPLGEEYSIDGIAYSASTSFTAVASGTYNVTVRLASDNTCISTATPATIDPAPALPAAPTLTLTQPTCSVPTGTIDVIAPLGEEYSIDGVAYSASTSFTAVASGTYNVTVRLASDNTCISTATPATIDPVPTVPVTPTVIATDATCSSPTGTIDFTAPLGAGLEYSIDGSVYFATVNFTGVVPNVYNATVRLTADPTCVSSPATATVFPAPTPPLAPTVSSMTQPTCSVPTGDITILTNAGEEYSVDGSTYQTAASFTALIAGNYTITARLTADPTCISGITPATLNTATPPTAPGVSVTQPTCIIPTGGIDITTPIAGEEYSIDGSTYQAAASFTAVVSGSYSVTARITADPSCISTGTPATVNLAPVPPLTTLTITPDLDTLCAGATSTVTISGTETGVTYAAFANGSTAVGTPVTGDGTNKDIVITYAELATGTNTITIDATSLGCPTATLLETTDIIKSVMPAPSINTSAPALCDVTPVVFTVDNTYSVYKWYLNSVNDFATSSQLINGGTISETIYEPGYYYVEVFDTYGCSLVSGDRHIDYLITSVNPTQSGNTGTQVDLSYGISSTYYQWYVENSSGQLKYIQGANSANFRAYFDGTYYVAIRSNDCYLYSLNATVTGMEGGNVLRQGFYEDDSSIVIPEMNFSEIISVQPNPSNGIFEVKYLSTSNEPCTIILYNSHGAIMDRQEIAERGFVTLPFDKTALTSGVYVIEKVQKGKVTRERIMIQK